MKDITQKLYDYNQLYFHPHPDYETTSYDDLEHSDTLEHGAVFDLIDAVYSAYGKYTFLAPTHKPTHTDVIFSVMLDGELEGRGSHRSSYPHEAAGDLSWVLHSIHLKTRDAQTFIHELVHAAQVESGTILVGSGNSCSTVAYQFQLAEIEAFLLQQRIVRDIKQNNPRILKALKSFGWDTSISVRCDPVAASIGWLQYAKGDYLLWSSCKVADVRKGLHDGWLRDNRDVLAQLAEAAHAYIYKDEAKSLC